VRSATLHRWRAGAPALACVLLAAGVARADLAAKAPPPGAVLGSTPVLFLGIGPEAGKGPVEATLNGAKVAGVRQDGSSFTVSLALKPGKNSLVLRAGAATAEYSYDYQPGAAGAYRFHPPVEEGDCKGCHPLGVGRTSPVTDARFCSACHEPKDKAKYVHGPLGGGQCSICHDPHGSSRAALLVTDPRELCLSCHDQNSSRTHTENSSGRPCTECHSPHGSAKKYLLY
jgi:predicted CXXCH cytochrome family protein